MQYVCLYWAGLRSAAPDAFRQRWSVMSQRTPSVCWSNQTWDTSALFISVCGEMAALNYYVFFFQCTYAAELACVVCNSWTPVSHKTQQSFSLAICLTCLTPSSGNLMFHVRHKLKVNPIAGRSLFFLVRLFCSDYLHKVVVDNLLWMTNRWSLSIVSCLEHTELLFKVGKLRQKRTGFAFARMRQ